jgi:hypothetical protein
MEPFEHEGAFWLPDQADRAIAGRLTYSPSEGASLTVYGSIVDTNHALSAEALSRIHGAAGRKKLTLVDCIHVQTNIQSPGIERQTFRVQRVLTGAHFGRDYELAFDEVAVAFDHLQDWIGKSGFSLEFDTGQSDDLANATQLRIKYDVLQDETVNVDTSELSLKFGWSLTNVIGYEQGIKQHAHLIIKYAERRRLNDIMEDVSCLQDLVTLAVDAPAVLTEIDLWRSDIVHEHRPDVPTAIGLYAAFIAENVRQKDPQPSHLMFFPFEQVGALDAVGRWLAVSRTYRAVLGSLLTVQYASHLYAENRYYNVITASETFHRIRFPNEVMPRPEYRALGRKLVRVISTTLGRGFGAWLNAQLQYANEPRLRARLEELAKYSGPVFSWLVGDVAEWARTVTNARNRLTHHDQNRQLGVDYTRLYYLSDSLYVLVMLCLLRECGLTDQVLEGLKRAPRIVFLKERLELEPEVGGDGG